MDHLCATIHEQLIPLFVILVNQVRLKLKPAGWYKLMISKWRDHNKTIAAEDEADEMDDNDAAWEERQIRMMDIHHTDLETWSCTCVKYMISPYHLCKHLVRQYGPRYPGKGEIIRQRTAPLMWIEDIHSHDPDFREIQVNPSQAGRPRQATASLDELGVSQEDLELLEATFPQQELENEDPRSSHALQLRRVDEFQEELEWLLEEFKNVCVIPSIRS
jgi:hypothetical protein